MKVTLENYEEVKKELAEFEAKEKYRLEQIEKEKRIKELKRKFLNSLPKNCGLLCYVTQVKIDINYNSCTPNFQGETKEHITIEMPTEIYDEVLKMRERRKAESALFPMHPPWNPGGAAGGET